ncbi:MAG: hypothetical protein IT367_16095 [Candidatus Hydrogenedentes bacterium]|nr:hypothetical protein [Candidatus Hydrogenedentota bacterium]
MSFPKNAISFIGSMPSSLTLPLARAIVFSEQGRLVKSRQVLLADGAALNDGAARMLAGLGRIGVHLCKVKALICPFFCAGTNYSLGRDTLFPDEMAIDKPVVRNG